MGIVMLPWLLAAKPSIGLDMTADYSVGSGTGTYNVSFGPSLHFMLPEKLELAPSVILGYSGVSNKDNQTFSYSQLSLGGATGLYFHLFSNEWFHFSLGPDIQAIHYFKPVSKMNGSSADVSANAHESISLGMPLNFDIRCSPKVTVRTAFRVFALDGDIENGGEHLSSRIKSLPQPKFNLLYTF
jgi:hypothetical protein